MATRARAYPGDRVTVELRREEAVRGLRPAPPHLRAVASAGAATEPARAAIYDLGTRYQFDHYPGLLPVSKFTQTALETSVLFNATHQLRLRGWLLDGFEETAVAFSGREILSAYRLQVSPETEGTATALVYHQHGETRRFVIQSEGRAWARAVPVEERLERIESLEAASAADSPDRQTLRAAARRTVVESYEQWDTISRQRRGAEGTAGAHLTDGQWALGLESLRHYQPFETWDTANYKVTEEPIFLRARVPASMVRVGRTESTWTDVACAPQMHQYTVAWHALYLVGTLWFFSLTAFATIGTLLERLPFYPYAYNVASPVGALGNEGAVAYMLSRTREVARMKAFDLSVQIWSPYFFLILVARVSGRAVMNYINIPRGSLCAVVRTRYQGGPPITRYVWRETALVRDNDVFDFLPYGDEDVIPMGVIDIENGPPLPEPTF